MTNPELKYPRALLKLSGELFGGESQSGVDYQATENIARQIIEIKQETKADLAIVVGGGNIVRGRNRAKQVKASVADQMGMLGTVINGLAFQEALERLGQETRMLTSIKIEDIAEPYIQRRALRHLEKGRLVILAAGLGRPYFTTDTGAAHRAVDLNCNILLKATNVDGIFSKDPNKNPDAVLYRQLTYKDALKQGIEVMDSTAFAFCKDQHMPVVVFNIKELSSVGKILKGEQIGTVVSN